MDKGGINKIRERWFHECAEMAKVIAAKAFNVSTDVIKVPNRSKANIALARQTAMYLCHVVCSMNLSDIARYFSRDRTTVSYACRRVEDKRDDTDFDISLEHLESDFKCMIEKRKLEGILDPETAELLDRVLQGQWVCDPDDHYIEKHQFSGRL